MAGHSQRFELGFCEIRKWLDNCIPWISFKIFWTSCWWKYSIGCESRVEYIYIRLCLQKAQCSFDRQRVTWFCLQTGRRDGKSLPGRIDRTEVETERSWGCENCCLSLNGCERFPDRIPEKNRPALPFLTNSHTVLAIYYQENIFLHQFFVLLSCNSEAGGQLPQWSEKLR